MNKPIAWVFVGAMGFSLYACRHKNPPPNPEKPTSASASTAPEPESSDPLTRGLWWLYHLQYEKSRDVFKEYGKNHPGDPAGYFYLTAVDWWQLAQNFELSQPEVARQFRDDSQKTIELAEALGKNERSSERARAFLFEGGAWGLRGRFEVTQGRWLEAYKAGKRGHADLEKALHTDPRLEDAYLGLGIYDYYADTLHGVQGVLSKLLMHGDRKRGIAELKRAMSNGPRSRVEAMLFLIDIYTSWEKQPDKAAELAHRLRQDFPQSPAMHLAVVSTLAASANWEATAREAQRFLERCKNAEPYFTRQQIPAGLYYAGLAALHEKQAKEAVRRMNEILAFDSLPPGSRWITFAYLRRGQAEDALGAHDQAQDDYKRVLARPDVWNSHQEASSFVTSRPKGTSN